MSQATLSILIKAQDMASQVMNTVGSATQDLAKKSQNLAQAGFNAVTESGKKMASALGGAVVTGFKSAGVALIGLGAIGLKSASDMETMGVALETALGGNVKAAQEAQKQITEFAAKTPFELQEVMGAFIKLKNMGLDPSQKAMTSYGDTASAMGKNLNDMVEAVADAATGEFERLKEFGIRSESQGNKVKFTFKGVTTTVGKNSKEIEDYLIKLGQTNFAGGMEKQSQTLSGMLSTLKDNFSLAMGGIAQDIGLVDGAKAVVGKLSEVIGTFDPQPLKNGVAFISEIIELLYSGEVQSGDGLFNVFGAKTGEYIQNINNVRGAILDMWDVFSTGELISGDGFKNFFSQEQIDGIVGGINLVKQSFTDFLSTGADRFKMFWSFVKDTLIPGVMPVLQRLGDVFINQVMPFIVEASQKINEAIAFAMPYITDLIKQASDIITPIIERIANEIFPLLLPIIDQVLQAFKIILPIVKPILDVFVQIAGNAMNMTITVFKGFLQFVGGFLEILIGIFTGNGGRVRDGFVRMFDGISTAVGGVFKGIMNNMINVINSGVRNINGLVNGIPDDVFKAFGKSKGDVRIPEIPRFQDGGIVGGNSTTGDKILARVNSGELILNQKQQASLDNQLSSGGTNISINITGTFLGTAKDRREMIESFGPELLQYLNKTQTV